MIWFVYGEPRTGKSLFGGLVDAVLPALKRGRRVYTNIPLIRLGICVETHIGVMEYNKLIHEITELGDVLEIYDSEEQRIKREFLDTVFILDEFRAMRGLTAKTELAFTKVLNVAGKSAVDFYLIAQLPTYFDADTRDLGEGCSYFERGDKMGKKNHSIEWLFDKKGGTPTRIGNRWDTEHWRYRYRDPKYFNMYHSYVETEFMQNRGEDHRALPFWQRRSFKLAMISFGVVAVVIVVLLLMVKSTKNQFSTLTGRDKAAAADTLEQPPKRVDLTDIDQQDTPCYVSQWINDGVVTFKLKDGSFAYNPSVFLRRCSDL